ncbi:heavy metal-associated isoprenylated plant protein 6-like [Olea europaea var. sylvestris]|uniref:heavy metal-associated isoprenylated plant protein 6-like n=1 Tax=Olea europaea var. sylvestris TaxID=158386 RepID=UPI000C1D0749|nr:heavy metal-associated isoprenylated plant protein 6-like [Olea europaea var. sylvestris]
MAEKVTEMVLKVDLDLQCHSCYKKIKKILCKIPQIRGQIYDDKQNTVTIDVVCCSPEKIRDKLCCKGGKVIKSIEIKEPKKNKKPDKSPEENPGGPTKTEVSKPPEQPPPPPVNKPESIPLHPPARTCCGPCSEGHGGGPCYRGYPSFPPRYDGCYGYGYWCRCGCGCGSWRGCQCHLRKCICDCYIEETPSAECKIM